MRSKELSVLLARGIENFCSDLYIKTFFIAAFLVLRFTLVSSAQPQSDNDVDGRPFTATAVRIEVNSIDGSELDGAAILTHDLPCGPELIFPEEDETLNPDDTVVIVWEEVTNKLNLTTGECGDSSDLQIIGYQIVVDRVDSDPKQRFDIKVPANVTTITVPPEFIVPVSEYTVEVLAIEASGNQTITESGFLTSN